MPPSFIFGFTSLLLFGPHVALLVAVGAAVAQELGHSQRSYLPCRLLLATTTAMVAIWVAGLAHRGLGGTIGDFMWPWQGVPIAGAVVGYCVVKSASAELRVLLITRQPVDRSLPQRIRRDWPSYFIGAGLAVGLAEVIAHRLWEILPAATVPLFFAYRVYIDSLNRLEDGLRLREVIDSLDEGLSVVDDNGCVTLWNDVLERLLGCPRERILGRSLHEAVPVLSATEFRRAIKNASTDRKPRTLRNLRVACAPGVRILEVTITPVVGGARLLWRDVTARPGAARCPSRSEQRLALAAEGAKDGLWEWDFRSQDFYVSSRWRAMLGLPACAGVGRPEEWIGRVHADDIASLREALQVHFSGETAHFEHEHRIRHENGNYRRFLCRGVAVRGAGRRPVRIAGSLTDITERAIEQERIRRAGFLDPLTGLCNRAVFMEGLGRRLEEGRQRRVGDRFAVLYLDLDRFKVVNDSLGHLVGDELLIAVSRRLEVYVRPGDALARLGGDEFVILLNGLDDEQQANVIAFRIQKALSAAFSIGGREVFTTASIGIAPGLAHYTSPDEIMRDADTAMYQAKARGKARHEVFDAGMHERARDRLGLESDLRNAVNSNQFEVHYQPIVSLASGMCVGFESLLRWTRNGKAISPATFIPIAEELGLIEFLGNWVLQEACCTFAAWRRRFPAGGLDCITVNVSSRQLTQQNFPYLVEQAVRKAGLKPCALRVEITETALMDSLNMAAEVLRELRKFGVKIYLDDFGTGHSSLSHLHKLPVDALKIDRSFVRDLLLPDRPAIVESILALARTLNTSVVAEGIESAAQARELRRLGCTHAQGFLFSRPLSARLAEELIMKGQPLGPMQTQPPDSDPVPVRLVSECA